LNPQILFLSYLNKKTKKKKSAYILEERLAGSYLDLRFNTKMSTREEDST